MRNKISFGMLILMVSMLLTACASAAYAQTSTATPVAASTEAVKIDAATSPEINRNITVSGSGKTFLTPDIAYVSIGVHTENKNAAEAVAQNNTLTQQVMDAILKIVVDKKDIQTTNFSIYPQPQYDQDGKPTGQINYIVDNTVMVTVRDLGKIGELLDAAVKSGANSISGIQFDVEDKEAALSQARRAAVASARAKAEELASAAGVTLGAIQTINEYSSSAPTPMYDMRASAPMVAEAAVPVSPGQMTITVEVNIVFDIR